MQKLWPALLVASGALALSLATNGAYGFFRDELYFVACGRHPSWGYVDQPPIAPLIAAASAFVSGERLWLFRMPAALAHAALVLLTGLFARRLGGGNFAMALAALGVAASPTLIVSGHLLTMNAFEPLFWLGLAMVVSELLQGGDELLWLAAGGLAGLGVLNKHSMLFFAAALLAAVLLTPQRRALRSRKVALGAGLALLIALPHALWQLTHGLPMLELLRNGQLYKNAPFAPGYFFFGQLLEVGPLVAPLWLSGLAWLLFGEQTRRLRAIGLAYLVVLALFFVLRGKVYYVAPAYPMLIAAGGVTWEKLARPLWARVCAIGLVAAGGLALTPFTVPLLSEPALIAWQDKLGVHPVPLERHEQSPLPQHLADEHGWPRLVGAVAGAWQTLTPAERARGSIVVDNYGQAGAIDFFGPRLGLPPASSGHNQYFLWGPQGRGEVLVGVHDEPEDWRPYCDSLEVRTLPPDGYAMPYENAAKVLICRGLRTTLEAEWPKHKHFE